MHKILPFLLDLCKKECYTESAVKPGCAKRKSSLYEPLVCIDAKDG